MRQCAIVKDETAYYPSKDGSVVNNLYEKFTVKIKLPYTVDITVGSEVKLLSPSAVVYGDYQNKLSVTAEGIESVSQKGKV